MNTIERTHVKIGTLTQIKRFSSSSKLNAFLCKSDNACWWKESKHDVKSGHYLIRINNGKHELINSKDLPLSMIRH